MVKPVELGIRIDDEGVQTLKETQNELKSTGRAAKKTTSTMQRGFKKAHDQLKRVRSMMFSLKGGLVAIGAAVAGGVFAKMAQALIAPSRQVEKMTVAFKVLMGSARLAKQRLKELTDFARLTPFELPEVFGAARIMRVFGIDTDANLRLVGDAAATAQVSIQELALWFGRLSSGSFGEAFVRLEELGVVTREQLSGRGLVFDKSKSYQGTVEQAMDAVGRHISESFGGMMDEQSRTLDGMISNWSDFVFQSKLKLGDPLFQLVKGSMVKILEQADILASSGKLEEWGDKIAEGAGKGLLWFARVVDFIRNEVVPGFKSVWEWLNKLPGAVESFDMQALGENLGEAMGIGFKRAFSGSVKELPALPALKNFFEIVTFARERTLLEAAFGGQRTRDTGGGGSLGSTQTGGGGTANAVKEGLDKSNLAGAIEKLLAGAPGGGAGTTVPGGDTQADQQNLINTRFAQPLPDTFGGRIPGELNPDPAMFQIAPPVNEGVDSLEALKERSAELYQEMLADALENLGRIETAWMDFRLNTVDIFGGWFEDLADTSLSGSERWQAILDDMKRNALRSVASIVTGWVKEQIIQGASERALQATMIQTSAIAVTTAATQAAASRVLGNARHSEAVASIFAAHANIPFVGVPIAAGLVAQMEAVRAGVQFLAGGGVVRGGSGTRDDVPAVLTGGEGVVSRQGMNTLGEDGLQALNSGGGAGGGVVQLNLEVHAAPGTDRADLEAMVEDTIVPALEDLIEQNRLNLFGSKLQGA